MREFFKQFPLKQPYNNTITYGLSNTKDSLITLRYFKIWNLLNGWCSYGEVTDN